MISCGPILKGSNKGSWIPELWIRREALLPTDGTAYGVAYGDNLWVAGASNGRLSIASDPTGSWENKQIPGLSYNNNIRRTIYENNLWTVVGEGNVIATATDPTGTWTLRTSPLPSNQSLTDIKYDGISMYVIGASNGHILTATDPTGTWTLRATPTARGIESINYGNGIWTAVCQYGIIITAPDPTGVWTLRTNPFLSDETITDVAYGDGLWVAVGGNGLISIGSKIATATDPTGTWTLRTSPFNPLTRMINGVAYGNGVWTICDAWNYGMGPVTNYPDRIATAIDPTAAWTLQSISTGNPYNLSKLAYADNIWVVTGSGDSPSFPYSRFIATGQEAT